MEAIINEVKYYSQFKGVNDEWKNKACTIACLKMAMEFVVGQRMPSIDDLYKEASVIQRTMIENGTLAPKSVETGLLHDVIVNVAHNNGVAAHKEEFRSMRFNIDAPAGQKVFFSKSQYHPMMYYHGLQRIYGSILRRSPVIVSAKRNFDPAGTHHSVLIIGFNEGSGFYYHDPDCGDDNEAREKRFVSLVAFEQCWRRLAIFVDNVKRE